VTLTSDLMNLKGRRFLITGAAGHIGHVMADTLAQAGADLLLVDLPHANYGPRLEDLRARGGGDVQRADCDLEQPGDRARLIETVRQNERALHGLVHSAAFVGTSGLPGWVSPFEEQSVDTWRRALEVNVTAAFELTQGLTPRLRASGAGVIVNVASIYGLLGPNPTLYEGTAMGNPAAYAASKGALIQLTRWLATTLAPAIRVNAVAPGGVLRGQPDVFVERYRTRTPLGRMATEDDLRGVTLFLCSDLSRYVTGQTIEVDGGFGVW